jgi:hypothetical protein
VAVKILIAKIPPRGKNANSNLYFTLFQKISEHLTILLNIQPKKKEGI